jgi:hypothetical protein
VDDRRHVRRALRGHDDEGLTAAGHRWTHGCSPVPGPEPVRRSRASQRRQPVVADVAPSSAPSAIDRRDSAHARSTSGSQDHSERTSTPPTTAPSSVDIEGTRPGGAPVAHSSPVLATPPVPRDPTYAPAAHPITAGRYGCCRAPVR